MHGMESTKQMYTDGIPMHISFVETQDKTAWKIAWIDLQHI